MGLRATLLPATDDRLRTMITIPEGEVDFQTYYVRRGHADPVLGIRFDGAEAARPAPGVLEAIAAADVVVIAPSNPFISIDPILAVPGIRAAVAARRERVVAVSPIVAGQALRGPAAAMLSSLGHETSAVGVAGLYRSLAASLLIDLQGRCRGRPRRAARAAAAGDRHGDDRRGREPGARRRGARGRRAGRVSGRLEILALPHPDEIAAGTDLATLVLAVAPPLRDGDVVVVAHKAVSKSEGRVADLAAVEPSARALELSAEGGDPRMAELVLRESRRIVRRRAGLLIAETHHGFVCASAGIDRSNAAAADWVVLLPVDPDASAARLRTELERRCGARLAVIVADTMGRALRRGIVGTAIGVAGVEALRGYAGEVDPSATSCARPRSPSPTSWPPPPTSCWASSSGCRQRSSAATGRRARAAGRSSCATRRRICSAENRGQA